MGLLDIIYPIMVFGMPIVGVILAYFIGGWIENRHFRRLETAEAELAEIMVTDLKRFPSNWEADEGSLVAGEVVIANDRFKSWLAGWITIFGGRISTYETLLERARREAIVRMMREAEERGANAVWNVRIVTSYLAGGVEAFAYGTAVHVSGSKAP